MFVYPDRRRGQERRSGRERRDTDTPFDGLERRQKRAPRAESPTSKRVASKTPSNGKPFYTTAEVADMTGLSQTTLLLWIRNKVIDGSRIKRSLEGRRLWSREDVNEIERIKSKNGWMT